MTKAEQLRILTAILLPHAIGPTYSNEERIGRAKEVAELIYKTFEDSKSIPGLGMPG